MLIGTLLVCTFKHAETISEQEDKLFQALERRRKEATAAVRIGWGSSSLESMAKGIIFMHEDKLFEEFQRRRKEKVIEGDVFSLEIATRKKKLIFQSPSVFKPARIDDVISDNISNTSTVETEKVRNPRKEEIPNLNDLQPFIPRCKDGDLNNMSTAEEEKEEIIRSLTMVETESKNVKSEKLVDALMDETEKEDAVRRINVTSECAICMCCGDPTSSHKDTNFVLCGDCRSHSTSSGAFDEKFT